MKALRDQLKAKDAELAAKKTEIDGWKQRAGTNNKEIALLRDALKATRQQAARGGNAS